MTNFKKALLTASAAVLLLPAFTMNAATDSATFEVRATVAEVCVIDSAADLDFGTITPNAAAEYTASGDVEWRCTNGTAADLSLDGGTTTSDITARAMDGASGASDLTYQLFTDAAFANVFGDGTNGDVASGTGAGMAAANAQSTTVYGRVLDTDAVNADPDTYADTVTVTLTF